MSAVHRMCVCFTAIIYWFAVLLLLHLLSLVSENKETWRRKALETLFLYNEGARSNFGCVCLTWGLFVSLKEWTGNVSSTGYEEYLRLCLHPSIVSKERFSSRRMIAQRESSETKQWCAMTLNKCEESKERTFSTRSLTIAKLKDFLCFFCKNLARFLRKKMFLQWCLWRHYFLFISSVLCLHP